MMQVRASSRAKAVLLLIADRPPEIQLQVIEGAIRGATEQAARIAERRARTGKNAKLGESISAAIRKTMT